MAEVNWTQFFKDAGIPLSIAKSYSATFEDNRMSKDMLPDLNKDILTEMGINVMGDIINILKHAKKIHSQDAKKMLTTTPKTVITSNKRPPPPAAHSTTPGQASMVSTTSTSAQKKIAGKYMKKAIPDSISANHRDLSANDSEMTYITYVEPGKKLFLESQVKLRPHQMYLMDEPQENDYYVESTTPVESSSEMIDAGDLPVSYETSHYEAKKLKRSSMYSDDPAEYSQQPKHPRVIILPGEGQDIFTTTGLQKAAKVYESGEEHESVTKDRSRRLLESAGLIPAGSKDRSSGDSIFSRLDYTPSSISSPPTAGNPILTQFSATSTPAPPVSSPSPKRVIKLTRTSNNLPSLQSDVDKSTSSSKRKIVSISPNSKIVRSGSSGILVKRPASTVAAQPVSKRVTIRERAVSNPVSERLGSRSRESSSVITSTTGVGVRTKAAQRLGKSAPSSGTMRSGLFGYGEAVKKRKPATEVNKSVKAATASTTSMIADEYEYQTQRHRDIRSRLEIKEFEKRVRRGGPLAGRLGSHKVFGRLE